MADSVQLWGNKAANGRYSELGEGMLDRQGASVAFTAVAGIENRVAPEDLPLSRLPSRAARCLAGRRPLEPVAEVPLGQVHFQQLAETLLLCTNKCQASISAAAMLFAGRWK